MTFIVQCTVVQLKQKMKLLTEDGHFNHVADLKYLFFFFLKLMHYWLYENKQYLTLYIHSSGNNIKIQPTQVLQTVYLNHWKI